MYKVIGYWQEENTFREEGVINVNFGFPFSVVIKDCKIDEKQRIQTNKNNI